MLCKQMLLHMAALKTVAFYNHSHCWLSVQQGRGWWWWWWCWCWGCGIAASIVDVYPAARVRVNTQIPTTAATANARNWVHYTELDIFKYLCNSISEKLKVQMLCFTWMQSNAKRFYFYVAQVAHKHNNNTHTH